MDGLTSEEIVGLLAEGDRLRVVAALVLGATMPSEVAASSGLEARRVGKALTRLERNGLVELDGHGYRLREEDLRAAARAAAAARAVADEHADAPPETARVLRAFVRDGRLLSIPTTQSKRLVVLDLLAQRFDPGTRYPEAQVNLLLGLWHPDTAALRRYLVDEGYLDRAAGWYWRSGGSVNIEPDADASPATERY